MLYGLRDRQTKRDHKLKLLNVHQARKTLGHFKEPVGNQSAQYTNLKKKSDEITAFLWTCPLTRLEAWTYYFACYLPSVGYPLASSSLSKRQLDDVQKKAMAIIVARCGYNRNTKKEVLYGPLELGGANFRPLYVMQGTGQVQLFVRHWRLNSEAGKLLKIAVAWFQQQVGTSFSILDNVSIALPHLESKWINSLRLFLATTSMSLELDNAYIPARQRENDMHLMDVILASKKFTEAEIRRLNYCRLFLKATTIADITMIDGKSLDRGQVAW